MSQVEIRSVLAERGAKHGDYTEQARVTQNLKAMARNSVNWKEARLSAVETDAIEMILVKLGRILAGDPHHRDHWDDIAGYATLAADRAPQAEPAFVVATTAVLAGLDPAIHDSAPQRPGVDARHKAGHDAGKVRRTTRKTQPKRRARR